VYDGEWRPPASAYQPYGQPAPGYEQPERPKGPNRTAIWIAVAAAVLVLILVAAFVNTLRNRNTNSASGLPTSAPAGPLVPAPSSPSSPNGSGGGNGGSGGGAAPIPTVACPLIRDDESHISYRCIDNYLVQGQSDTLLGLRISLDHEVEPGWVISEGSGNPKSIITPPNNSVGFRRGPSSTSPTPGVGSSPPVAVPAAQQVIDEVHRRTNIALQQAYGANPTSKTLSGAGRSISGVQGYVLQTEVTMNPIFRAAAHLKAKTERLWVVGLPTKAGISIFMMSIPDERSDLWPKADATINAITVF
jgi:hypothetical protein